MTYSTPELRLVGAAHTFVLGLAVEKIQGGQEYEPEGDQTFSDRQLEQAW